VNENATKENAYKKEREKERERETGEEEKEKERIMKRAKVINSFESDQLFQRTHFFISFLYLYNFQLLLFLHLGN